ncbi:HIT family protein [Planctomicrobium sp. SH661]|uniref:HIT family protein n=1 Tax=Planctomicrobium sp. SH661 TaxID=3448124 RepID=UPI003F5BFAF7
MLHAQLVADCHVLREWAECHVLLHRNAIVPWFILVPKTELADLLELPSQQREAVMAEAAVVSKLIQEHWNLQKINFAQLGNVVPQMHLHVIGRAPGDDCWPKPVWGNLSGAKSYSDQEVAEIAEKLDQLHHAG